jgi:hypothetical protein
MSQKEIRTRVAHHLVGDNRFFGLSVKSLVGSVTYTDMIALAATGRRPTLEQRESLDELAAIVTSADPRIWPVKLTRLLASYGGTVVAYAAGQLTMENEHIGPWVTSPSAAALVALRAAVGDDETSLDERVADFVKRTPRIIGYGVPFRTSDERLEMLVVRMRLTGRDQLPFWKLHVALNEEMKRAKGLVPNITAGLAAMLLDHGYTPHEAATLTTFLWQAPFAANATEAATQSEETMRTLPDSAIDYVGQPPRTSPRARARENARDRISTENSATETF